MTDTLLAEALRQRFQADGFVCIEGWLDSSELDALCAEADALLAEHTTEETLRLGCVHETVPLHTCCSSVAQFTRATCSPGSCSLLFTSEKVSRTAALLLSPSPHTAKVDDLRLFNEQFILKPAHAGSAAFGWHRDSDWLDGQPPRYVSLWCALDDVSEENGTLYVLPGSHVAVNGELPPPPRTDAQASSCIMTVPAGTLVALSSTVLHCSGRNLSDAPRRAWMPQVSVGALVDPAGWLARHAVPLPSQ
jgi:ectoine hydroxylase-related dioxygenase (phytanoyl-CoA dioxygenase family)